MRAVIKNGVVTGYTSADKQGVEFKNPVYKIAKDAFKGCNYKFNIDIPMGVVIIEKDAFTNSKFSIINVPYSVTKIEGVSGFKGRLRFKDRYSLVGVELDDSWDRRNVFFGNRMKPKYYFFIALYLQIILIACRVFKLFTGKTALLLCLSMFPLVGVYKTLRISFLERKWGRNRNGIDGNIRSFK